MTKISIARALAEHKLIDKKIEKAIANIKFCNAKRGKKEETLDGTPIATFNANAKISLDSIKSLVTQKNALKAAIIASNAATVLTVGKTEMTVAAAIERKRTIDIEKRILNGMKADYVRAKQYVERESTLVQNKLDSLLESNFGGGKSGSAKSEEVEAISKPYLENNQVTLIDSLKMEDEIRVLETKIDEFEKNVDFSLNESNVRTEIEVSLEA